jgi:hypothetical protein
MAQAFFDAWRDTRAQSGLDQEATGFPVDSIDVPALGRYHRFINDSDVVPRVPRGTLSAAQEGFFTLVSDHAKATSIGKVQMQIQASVRSR